jgi:hypothetical protein
MAAAAGFAMCMSVVVSVFMPVFMLVIVFMNFGLMAVLVPVNTGLTVMLMPVPVFMASGMMVMFAGAVFMRIDSGENEREQRCVDCFRKVHGFIPPD